MCLAPSQDAKCFSITPKPKSAIKAINADGTAPANSRWLSSQSQAAKDVFAYPPAPTSAAMMATPIVITTATRTP